MISAARADASCTFLSVFINPDHNPRLIAAGKPLDDGEAFAMWLYRLKSRHFPAYACRLRDLRTKLFAHSWAARALYGPSCRGPNARRIVARLLLRRLITVPTGTSRVLATSRDDLP